MTKPIFTSAELSIRTFGNIADIESLIGFKRDNPISKETYNAIIGDYYLLEEVRCCFQKENQNLCGEKHKWGFVAQLNDGSITILGNNCAITKFDADSKLGSDRARYLNEKDRQERLARLSMLIQQKDTALLQAEKIKSDLLALQSRIHDMRSKLGPQTLRSLESIARSGAGSVSVAGISIRKYVDKKGKEKIERTSSSMRIGSIPDISFLIDSNHRDILVTLNEVKSAYTEAEEISVDAKTSKLTAISSKMNRIESARNLAMGLIEKEERFRNSDLSLLCFLISDRAERYKSAKFALEHLDLPLGKEKAKEWLTLKEREICTKLNVDKIEIPL